MIEYEQEQNSIGNPESVVSFGASFGGARNKGAIERHVEKERGSKVLQGDSRVGVVAKKM